MKKITALLLALALVLCAVSSLAEGKPFTTKYFTLTLPDTWDIGTDPAEESEDGEEDLGYFYDASKDVALEVMVYMELFEEMKDVSLWNASEAELKDYADMLLEEFGEDHPVLLGTLMAGNIPFVVIRGTDEYGDYIYAETMTNGYAIVIDAVVTDASGANFYPLTDDHIEQFKSILLTFVPVT
jgi:hypothetical protein